MGVAIYKILKDCKVDGLSYAAGQYVYFSVELYDADYMKEVSADEAYAVTQHRLLQEE